MTIVNTFITNIINNTDIIIFVIILIALTVYAYKKGKAGLLAATLYLVSVAEEEWGSKTGKIKFAEVLSTLKKTYPVISLLIREKDLEKIIEDALKEMKEILSSKESENEE